jgi:type I restriction enzyme, S subunit
MSPDLLLAQFDRLSDAPDAIPRLRRFILDLAVRGKLVEQDPKDEPASALLKRVKAEKARLVRDGKIRRQTPQPDIQPAGFPFLLPKGWITARLGDVIQLLSGQHLQPGEYSEQTGQGPPYITGPADFGKSGLVITRYALVKKAIAKRGQILLTVKGAGVGKTAICDMPEVAISRQLMAMTAIDWNQQFLLLTTHRLATALIESARSLIPGISREDVDEFVFPLPPLAEQQRIVTKVDELMVLCDRLEAAIAVRMSRYERLSSSSHHHINNATDVETLRKHAHFYIGHLRQLTAHPDQILQLRQTVLNLAVRGQLVPQNPSDEPALELLKRIQAEIQRLSSDAKRKNALKLPPIDLGATPFELPSGWTWARFPELGTFGRGKSKHRPRNDASLFRDGTHLFIQTGDVARSKGIITTYTNKYNETGLAQSLKWPKGTMCITIAANIADSGILSFEACFPDSVVGFIPASVFPNARYFEYFIRTAKANLLEFAPATAQKNINLEILNAVLIPLPPLNEQRRIVTKVAELMAICDQLETQLATTETGLSRLLDSVLHQALVCDVACGNASRPMSSVSRKFVSQ